jgi:predicted N-formylglutamate amidohydrolase
MKTTTLLFTSEHGGNEIPEEYTYLFKDHTKILKTHRGYDLGIWSLAETFSEIMQERLFKTPISRLVVDVNRSLWRRTLFSEVTKSLSKEEKRIILDKYYHPHQRKIVSYAEDKIAAGQKILHIATHSFTPLLNGKTRNTDIGLLYNPARSNEKLISKEWKKCLAEEIPGLRVRFNYPHLGKPDGMAARFRKIYPNESYLGIELEINQKFVTEDGRFPKKICAQIVSSLQKTLDHFNWL